MKHIGINASSRSSSISLVQIKSYTHKNQLMHGMLLKTCQLISQFGAIIPIVLCIAHVLFCFFFVILVYPTNKTVTSTQQRIDALSRSMCYLSISFLFSRKKTSTFVKMKDNTQNTKMIPRKKPSYGLILIKYYHRLIMKKPQLLIND